MFSVAERRKIWVERRGTRSGTAYTLLSDVNFIRRWFATLQCYLIASSNELSFSVFHKHCLLII